MKPPFAYYGGKTSMADRIVSLLPQHGHYVEPFAGSLAVLLAKPRAAMETVNDLDGNLMLFWRVLRDQPDELARICALTPHSRAEHEAAFDLDGAANDLERARRVWVLLSQGRGGSLRKTGWRFYGKASGSFSFPEYLHAYVDRMPPDAERLAGVSLECRPALELIRDYGQHEDVLLYVDPPYLGSVRSSRQYAVEMSATAEHVELCEALVRCRAGVVVSGYASPLYMEAFDGWHRVELASFTGQGNHASADGARTEVLWSNREIGHPTLFSEIEVPA